MTTKPLSKPWDEQLASEAWDSAHDAIGHYAEANLRRFAREAARAVELAGKAILARISPILIADPRSIESQLQLAGVTRGEQRIRTISARETLERLTRLLPALPVLDILPLLEVRDGSTHFLISDRDAVESLIVAWLAAMRVVQDALGADDAKAFGSYAETARAVREEHADRVERIVSAKIARAQKAFDERYRDLDASALTVILTAIAASISLDGYDEQVAECPACRKSGVIGGQHEFQEWIADYDVEGGEGYVSGVYPRVSLFTTHFRCPVCGLRLEGADELEAAKLETILDVEEARTEDFVEPDEDRYDD
jgi:hypothetical protein